MNIAVNPHWKRLKTEGVQKLGYQGFADFLDFAAHSMSNIGDEGAREHFTFAAKQIRKEGDRAQAA